MKNLNIIKLFACTLLLCLSGYSNASNQANSINATTTKKEIISDSTNFTRNTVFASKNYKSIQKLVMCTLCIIASYGGYNYLKALHPIPAAESCNIKNSLDKILCMQGLTQNDREDIRHITAYYQNPNQFLQSFKPAGILISGPPGTGKTIVAKSIAEAAGCEFIEVGPADVATPEAVAEIFTTARKKTEPEKCVVTFFDEMDKMASIDSESLNQFLVETTSKETTEKNILVLGATNFPEKIAPSAKRSGRLDYHLRVKKPTAAARLEMIKGLLEKVTHKVTPAAMQEAANLSEGLTYGDFKNAITRSMLTVTYDSGEDNANHTKSFGSEIFLMNLKRVKAK
jgi:hypothetical protein